MNPRILVAEDEVDQLACLEELFRAEGFEVSTFTDGKRLLAALEQESTIADVVVTDVGLPGMSGLDVCAALRESRPELPVIVVTGDCKLETAVTALRAGAYDYQSKPLQPDLLLPCLKRAIERRRLMQAVNQPFRSGTQANTRLSGESTTIAQVNELIGRLAASGASVMIYGETGSGKELAAQALHALSPRAAGPFVAINCAALPATLVESELFGYAKGAFTDARSARIGMFVEANGGTLFLDEVAELSLDNQAKLLRALQERKVRPLGSNTELAFDARVLCATHRDLESEVEAGRFRQDSFFRLNVVRIDVPPLRDRGLDVIHLAKVFLHRVCARDGRPQLELDPDVARKLLAYSWPGNVRELENCIERLAALSRGSLVVADLPEKLKTYSRDRFSVNVDEVEEILPLEEFERRYILRVVELAKNNRTRAAQMLQIDRRTLYRRLDGWGVPGASGGDAEAGPEAETGFSTPSLGDSAVAAARQPVP